MYGTLLLCGCHKVYVSPDDAGEPRQRVHFDYLSQSLPPAASKLTSAGSVVDLELRL